MSLYVFSLLFDCFAKLRVVDGASHLTPQHIPCASSISCPGVQVKHFWQASQTTTASVALWLQSMSASTVPWLFKENKLPKGCSGPLLSRKGTPGKTPPLGESSGMGRIRYDKVYVQSALHLFTEKRHTPPIISLHFAVSRSRIVWTSHSHSGHSNCSSLGWRPWPPVIQGNLDAGLGQCLTASLQLLVWW